MNSRWGECGRSSPPLGGAAPTYRHVAAAAELGMLAADRNPREAAALAVGVLAEAWHADAVSLLSLEPADTTFTEVAAVAYPKNVAHALAAEFPATRWHRMLTAHELPLSISDEPGQTFRRGWFYEQYIAPAGFRDGMTGALREGDRIVGLVHLSSSKAGNFGAELRHTLARVLPALARIVDVTGQAAQLLRRTGRPGILEAGGGAAALVVDGTIVSIPGRSAPWVLTEPSFRPILDAFTGDGAEEARFPWSAGRRWFHVRLRRPTLPGRLRQAALVETYEIEPPYGLTRREFDVLTHVAAGRSNPAIAEILCLSRRTVHTHVERILQKTGCASRAEAAVLAVREALVQPPAPHTIRAGYPGA